MSTTLHRHRERGRSRPRPRSRRPGLESLEGRLLLSAGDATDPRPYDVGTPTVRDIWVDPVHGSDSATGADRADALRSFTAAWDQIPADTPLTGTGYRIRLAAGDYTDALLTSDGWTSDRRGTFACPVEIVSADGTGAAVIHRGLDFQDDSYLYLIGLKFVTDPGADGGGNVVHVAASDHVLIRDCSLNGSDGTTRLAQETLKVNQVQDIWVEGSEIQGAFWFGLDFVAVEYGHVLGCSIHDTGDDALLLKGGTAQILVEGNQVYNGGVTGIAAGQGSGFEFMVAPWIHYEAYDLKIVDNIIHDTQNAGLAVRGGYDILMADNTLYRVGLDQGSGSGLVLISHGSRSLDDPADTPIVQAYHDAGGWGPTVQGDGSDPGEYIPNKHVYLYDNLIENPDGVQTKYADFDIADPVTPPAGWNIPGPSSATDDLQIRGNVIWNGPAGMDLGIDDPTLAAQVARDNTINIVRPDLVDPDHGNFAPVVGGQVAGMAGVPIPAFPVGDLPAHPLAPTGDPDNTVARDDSGRVRAATTPPGALDPGSTPAPPGADNPAASTAEVERLYNLILGRPPDAPGLAAAVAARDDGLSLGQLASALFHSTERESSVVASDYRDDLGRAGSPAEVAGWVAAIQSGMTEEQVAADFLDSAEFNRLHADDADFVRSLYADVLGRAGSAPDVSAWEALLRSGTSRSALVLAFLGSTEAEARAVDGLYLSFLGRPGDPDGVSSWVAALQAGASWVDVATLFAGSDEFRARADATAG